MSENVSKAIKKAIGSHGMWKIRLEQAIETQTSEFEVDFVRSCHNCEFGKWLDGDKSELSKYDFYKTVYDMHKNVHIKTADVMELALSGQKEKATELLEGDFMQSSMTLVGEMMKWSKSLS
jgi:hypothetical protein